jgi:hypothetical protein
MKKLIILFITIISVSLMSEVIYAKPGKGNNKDKSEKEKSIGVEKQWEKNQMAIDAKKNWGQLKKELKSEDNPEALKEFFGVGFDETREYTDKELKESIKAERRVRRELRKNESVLGSEIDIEAVIDEYLYRNTERVENYILSLDGFDSKSMDKMNRAKEKYDATLIVEEE